MKIAAQRNTVRMLLLGSLTIIPWNDPDVPGESRLRRLRLGRTCLYQMKGSEKSEEYRYKQKISTNLVLMMSKITVDNSELSCCLSRVRFNLFHMVAIWYAPSSAVILNQLIL